MSPEGEFWVCSETNFRMLQNFFRERKGDLETTLLSLTPSCSVGLSYEMVKSIKSDGLAANSSKMLIKSTVAVKNCHNYTWEESNGLS